MYLFEPRQPVAPRPTQAATAATSAFPVRSAVIVCAVTALSCVIYFVQPVHFSLVLKQLGVADPKAIGWISAIPSAGIPLGAVIFKLMGRTRLTSQFLLIYLFEGIGLVGIGCAPDHLWALGFAFIQQLGNGLIFPVMIAWAQSKFDFEHRGRGMGLWASAFFAAQFFSPALVGAVRHATADLQRAFVVFGVLSLGCAAFVLLQRWRGPEPATVPA